MPAQVPVRTMLVRPTAAGTVAVVAVVVAAQPWVVVDTHPHCRRLPQPPSWLPWQHTAAASIASSCTAAAWRRPVHLASQACLVPMAGMRDTAATAAAAVAVAAEAVVATC